MATTAAAGVGVEQLFVAVGCNRVAGCAAWSLGTFRAGSSASSPARAANAGPSAGDGRRGIVAFGGSTFVCLYDPIDGVMLQTLRGHTGAVHAVRWLSPRSDSGLTMEDERELVSVSADGTVRVWARDDTPATCGVAHSWACTATLTGHKGPATAMDAMSLPGGGALIVSCGIDKTTRTWTRASAGEAWTAYAAVTSAPKQTVECMALGLLPGFASRTAAAGSSAPAPAGVLLACGCVDSAVRLYHLAIGGAGGAGEAAYRWEPAMTLKGHSDWVRSLHFSHCATAGSPDLFLASGAQDHRVRVWRIADNSAMATGDDGEGGAAAASSSVEAFIASLSKPKSFTIQGGKSFLVALETVLIAHEHWVNSVRWQPPRLEGGTLVQPMCVVTASMDRTMLVWQPEEDGGVWSPVVRVGEVGGNTLGFFGGVMSPGGQHVMAHGYHGSLHTWSRHVDEPTAAGGDAGAGAGSGAGSHAAQAADNDLSGHWEPVTAASGHFGPVMDATWGTGDDYLVTASSDQTCRLFAPWLADDTSRGVWRELARPQVHGYDMVCCSMPRLPGVPHRLMSGADEKIIRVFDAPQVFLRQLRRSGAASTAVTGTTASDGADTVTRVLKAYVPELGLSNKGILATGEGRGTMHPLAAGGDEDTATESGGAEGALAEGGDAGSDDDDASAAVRPPLEEELVDHTVWPESQKLYGHGNELVCTATSNDGRLIASACKARAEAQAGIRLWTTDTCREVAHLAGHRLTVTQMAFSHSDQFLLSVSKDRQICLFERVIASAASAGGAGAGGDAGAGARADAQPEYRLVTAIPKAHKRVIWSCSWAPDDNMFVTGSRDSTVKAWTLGTAPDGRRTVSTAVIVKPRHAVTAISFVPSPPSATSSLTAPAKALWLGVGLESGDVLVLAGSPADTGGFRWAQVLAFPSSISHAATVRRLAWRWRRPPPCAGGTATTGGEDGTGTAGRAGLRLELASCSTDHSVRVFAVHIGVPSA